MKQWNNKFISKLCPLGLPADFKWLNYFHLSYPFSELTSLTNAETPEKLILKINQ
jgi:hypothetical protein